MKLELYADTLKDFSWGKKLPGAIYLHKDLVSRLPPLLTDLIQRGTSAARPPLNWNLLKIHTKKIALTFLTYPDFDSDPHPVLASAVKINMNTGSIVRTDYKGRSNPPILHRKETFLHPEDSRVPEFSALTQQEEKAGLYRDTSRIGLRTHWQFLLQRSRLTYSGHQLISISVVSLSDEGASPALRPIVDRHRTAIKRYDLSKPVKLLLEHGLLRKEQVFFDYGCGHGLDLEGLGQLGYQVAGWDPAFQPNFPKKESEVVNLGYVLNVIEDPAERIEALQGAFRLARQLLIVSVLASGQETDSHTRPYLDGFLTLNNTFQKFFTPGELEGLIRQHLGIEAITLCWGICLVFRNEETAEAFEAGRTRRRLDWSQISTQLQFSTPKAVERRRVEKYDLHRELLDPFSEVLLDLGRLPEPGEFEDLSKLRKAVGGLSRALKLVLDRHGNEAWTKSRLTRSEDTLVYLAMAQFRGKLRRKDLPLRTLYDIRAYFKDRTTAETQARDLLFAAGDPGELELALEPISFGVLDRNELHFTFHRDRLDELPPILRIYVHCGALLYGDPHQADLIKIHLRSGKLTFLQYADFFGTTAPTLETRIKINLRTRFVQVFDHRAEPQRLVSKEPFLAHTLTVI